MRILGRTGLSVSTIALGGASFGYVHKARGWDPGSPEGANEVQAVIEAAMDKGINYIDTAPAYGDGRSEELIGRVMQTRRQECVLATKVWYELDYQGVMDSVHNSLKRLQTDYVDIMQIHGRMYSDSDVDHITNGGVMDALLKLREEGKIGHIGITTEEPWTVIPFLSHNDVSVFQIAYNIIYQAAARHFLLQAQERDAGVVSMRAMTSGVFQRQMAELAPEWQSGRDLYEVSLKFVLSDSRIHSAIVGMRFQEEVTDNCRLLEGWTPSVDFASLPRLTGALYKADDAELPTDPVQ